MKTIQVAFFVTVLVTLTASAIEAIDEVTFYQRPVCNGHHYKVTIGNGCKNIPDWLTSEGWNLSIDPHGHCVKVYEGPDCREAVGYAYSASSNAREDVIRRCRSTKQLGFTTIRSFKRVPC